MCVCVFVNHIFHKKLPRSIKHQLQLLSKLS